MIQLPRAERLGIIPNDLKLPRFPSPLQRDVSLRLMIHHYRVQLPIETSL
jgi:hypothetical protein